MENNYSSILEYCDSCNLCFEAWNIRQYEIIYQGSKIHDQDKITLCYVCSKIAKYAEQLINNLQGYSVMNHEVQINKKPIKNLSIFNLGTLQLSDADSGDTVSSYSVTSAKNGKILTECGTIKIETDDNLYEHVLDNNAIYFDEDQTIIKQEYVKEEDYIPIEDLIGNDIDLEEKKRNRTIRGKETEILLKTDIKKETANKAKQIIFPTVHITTEQYIQEKLDRSKTDRYMNSQYKCTDCVIGFFHKVNYLKHTERHSERAGQFECDLCKQRLNTKRKLKIHLKGHLSRYKCTQCNLLRNQLLTIREHLYSVHKIGIVPKFECDKCYTIYNRKSSLRRHIRLKHKPRKKVPCSYCQKIYSSLETLKTHTIIKHPEKLSRVKQEKNHICQECGAAFRSASLLKRHELKHSDRKDFYCVECDKAFKSETGLKAHFKTTSIHLKYSELKLGCTQCEKRFSSKRNLERHTNSVHLNIKPYQCDLCSKAYARSWSLTEHKQATHEGYKLPRKYQCEICDKAFAKRPILIAHTRTHTGERPFKCDKCEARFTHSGTLTTHKKLVHLKLKRIKKSK